MKTFGHAGKDFVEKYLKMTKDEREALYGEAQQALESKIAKRDEYSSRIIAKLAIFYMTAMLIERFYDYDEFNADEILDFLVNFEESSVPSRSMEAKALQHIKDFIIQNQKRFIDFNRFGAENFTRHNVEVGYRKFIDKETVEFTMMVSVLKRLLEDQKINQYSNVLRHLEKQDFVKTFGKDNHASEKCNYLQVRVVKFIFKRDHDLDDIIEWYSPPESREIAQDKTPIFDEKFDDEEQVAAIFKEDEE